MISNSSSQTYCQNFVKPKRPKKETMLKSIFEELEIKQDKVTAAWYITN